VIVGLNLPVRALEVNPVTLTKSDVTDLLDAIRAGGDIDVIRKGVELVLQALIDAEATELIGAGTEGRSRDELQQRARDSAEHRPRLLG
jgi:hypothetical protein